MSDTTEQENTKAVENPATETTTDGQPGGGTPSREAAKYRRRLRDTETERDTLAETVTTLQRNEVERLAASAIANPAALWAAGVELSDVLAEDGSVDAEKVTAAAKDAAERLGLAQPRPANYVRGEGSNPSPTRSARDSMAAVVMGGE